MAKKSDNNNNKSGDSSFAVSTISKGDIRFNRILKTITITVILSLVGIFITLFISSIPSIARYGFKFFAISEWRQKMTEVSLVTVESNAIKVRFSLEIDPNSINNKRLYIQGLNSDIVFWEIIKSNRIAIDTSKVTNPETMFWINDISNNIPNTSIYKYTIVSTNTNSDSIHISTNKIVVITKYSNSIIYRTNTVLLSLKKPLDKDKSYTLKISDKIKDIKNYSIRKSTDYKISYDEKYIAKELNEEEYYEPEYWYGALPFITGTLLTSILALLMSLPVSIAIALLLGEYFTEGPVSTLLKTTNELLAGIPSIIYGFWAFFFIVPKLGSNILSSAIVLAIMIIPYSASIIREVISLTPNILKEAGYGLGGTRFQVIRQVIIPYSRSGIFAGTLLSFGRALGETMAVTMVIGNANRIPDNLLSSGQTIASLIANNFAEADGLEFASLTELALILFFITFVFGLIGRILIKKMDISGGAK